ncbi:MAG: hypothetical protein LM564_03300 [Desulfurococcaceae archaeon]|jgi:hypothetical protein|nr:hypothetical protein [Desulfurococcaceae archaeon]
MPRPGSCGELRERLEMARTLLHHIELDIRDTEYTLRVDPRDFVREHYEWLVSLLAWYELLADKARYVS